MKVLPMRIGTIAAGAVLGLASLSTFAHAASDTIYKYSTPKPGSYSINVMAMAPDSVPVDYSISWNGSGMKAEMAGCFNTGVNLPHGATVTAVQAFFTTAVASNSADFRLIREDLTQGSVDNVAAASVQSIGNRKVYSASLTSGTTVVNNIKYGYGFGVCLGLNTTHFHGARILYTVTNAGD